MTEDVAAHYGGGGELAEKISNGLQAAGRDLANLKTRDLSAIDEFHFRGREATLELAAQMKLTGNSRVLDIGSGLGGPARTLAEEYGCRVVGIDLTGAFCEVAGILSKWTNLAQQTEFRQGDATNLPFADNEFDAALTIHVAMNVAAKDRMYAQARRVLRPGGIFAVYDILQGEGGEPFFPAPWARDCSISHLVTADEMEKLLRAAGFRILDSWDSTRESLDWLQARSVATAKSASAPVTPRLLFGDDFSQMIRNQARALSERRIRTAAFVCEA